MDNYLILLVGIVGSGKSTYVNTAQSISSEVFTIVCPDEIRVELTGDITDQSKNKEVFELARYRAGRALIDGQIVIIDATNYNRKNRKLWLDLADQLGYKVECHVMKTTHEECRRRNAARERVVPDFVMDRMINGWQEPDKTIEKIEEIIYV